VTSRAYVLAGKPAADDIDMPDLLSGKRAHVFMARHFRPVPRQHAPAEWIDLAKGDRLESARALKAQVETTDASEQRQDAKAAHSATARLDAVKKAPMITMAGKMAAGFLRC
jgi:hypothetical protein